MPIGCPYAREVTFLPHRPQGTNFTVPLLLNFQRDHVSVAILALAIVKRYALDRPLAGEVVDSEQHDVFAIVYVIFKGSSPSHYAQQFVWCGRAIYCSEFFL